RTAFFLNGTATPRGSGSGGTVVPAPRPTGELGARLRVHEPGELPLRVQRLARGALQLARGRLGHRARFDEHDLLRRDADRVGDLAGDRLLHQLQVVRTGLGDDDDVLCAVAAVDTERDHVAGAHALDAAGDLLGVLAGHVAPADDDDVLDPPAHDELAVDRVGEVAGVQPPVPDELGGRLGVLVVAGGQ